MRLLVLVENLKLGGVQRVAATLSDKWQTMGHAVSVLTFENEGDLCVHSVSPAVELIQLGDPRRFGVTQRYFGKLLGALRAIWFLRAYFKLRIEKTGPFAAIGFLSHMCFYGRIASLGLPIKFISTESTYTPLEFGRLSLVLNFAKYLCFFLSDRLVVLTEEARQYFPRFLQKKISVIPNILHLVFAAQERSSESSKDRNDRKIILTMGRLSKEKRIDIILRAFHKLYVDFPNWNLHIAGEGPERKNIESLIDELGLSDRVTMCGLVSDVKKAYLNADLFVMSSDQEGFPNTLCEAMQSGLCVVSTKCSTGPAEIIHQGIDGFLVPVGDVDAFQSQLRVLMADDLLRKKIGDTARENIKRFDWFHIAPLWQMVFRSVGH